MSENRERVAVPKGIGRPGAALALDDDRIADLDPAEEQLGVLVFQAHAAVEKPDVSVQTRMGTIIGSEEVYLDKTIWSFLG